MIVKNALISNIDAKAFSEQITAAIDHMQKEGLIVEVHYQPMVVSKNSLAYSALLLGRVKGE